MSCMALGRFSSSSMPDIPTHLFSMRARQSASPPSIYELCSREYFLDATARLGTRPVSVASRLGMHLADVVYARSKTAPSRRIRSEYGKCQTASLDFARDGRSVKWRWFFTNGCSAQCGSQAMSSDSRTTTFGIGVADAVGNTVTSTAVVTSRRSTRAVRDATAVGPAALRQAQTAEVAVARVPPDAPVGVLFPRILVCMYYALVRRTHRGSGPKYFISSSATGQSFKIRNLELLDVCSLAVAVRCV